MKEALSYKGRFITGSLETVAFQTLAFQFARTTNGFGFFTSLLFRRLFKIAAQFHFTENAFALHFLFQSFQSLIDVVVANNYLYHFKDLSFHKKRSAETALRHGIPVD